MKLFSRFVLFCMCFEMIVAPMKSELQIFTTTKALAQAQPCPAGLEWSEVAFRCQTSAGVAQASRDLKACEGKTGEDLRKCYETNANNALGDDKIENIQDMYDRKKLKKSGARTAMVTAAYALPTMYFTYFLIKKKKDGVKCMPPSMMALMAAALVSATGEVYGLIKHKSNLSKLNKQRQRIEGKEATDNKDQQKVNATALQSEAFQLLADEQKSIAELGKAKKVFYGVAAGAYAVAAGLGVYEIISLNAAKAKWLAAVTAQSSTAPTLKIAYDNLQMKYTCGASKSQQSIDSNDSIKNGTAVNDGGAVTFFDAKNFKHIKTQLKLISQAKNADELRLLTDELNSISQGENQSYYETVNTDQNLGSKEIFSILSPLYAEMSASQIYSQYFGNEIIQMTEELPTKLSRVSHLFKNASLISEAMADPGDPIINYASPGGNPNDPTSATTEPPATTDTPAPATANTPAPAESNDPTGGKGFPFLDIVTQLGTTVGAGVIGKKINGDSTATAGANGQAPTSAAKPTIAEPESSGLKTHQSETDKYVYSPYTRIAFGGVLGGLSYFMSREMKKQQNTAETRQEKLLQLKSDFENTQGMKTCSPDERNDQKQPGCYCYTADGARNNARANSSICQTLWSSKTLVAGSYLNTSGPTTVCVNLQNQIDSNCACKSQKTSTGGNNCAKAGGFNISGISLGTISSLSNGLNPTNSLLGGTAGYATIDSDAALNNAFKLRDATDKLLTDPSLKDAKKAVDNENKKLAAFVNANQGSLPSSGGSRSTPSSLAGFNPQEALKEMEKEVKSANTGATAESIGLGNENTSPELEFGLTEDQAAIQEEQVAEVLNKDMDLGNNDISSSTTNLFEVLSHRYQRSGMRRLFDIEGKTKAEPAAATDINK